MRTKTLVFMIVVLIILSAVTLTLTAPITKSPDISTVTVNTKMWIYQRGGFFSDGEWQKVDFPLTFRVHREHNFTIIHVVIPQEQERLKGRIYTVLREVLNKEGADRRSAENRENFLAAMISLVPSQQREVEIIYGLDEQGQFSKPVIVGIIAR